MIRYVSMYSSRHYPQQLPQASLKYDQLCKYVQQRILSLTAASGQLRFNQVCKYCAIVETILNSSLRPASSMIRYVSLYSSTHYPQQLPQASLEYDLLCKYVQQQYSE